MKPASLRAWSIALFFSPLLGVILIVISFGLGPSAGAPLFVFSLFWIVASLCIGIPAGIMLRRAANRLAVDTTAPATKRPAWLWAIGIIAALIVASVVVKLIITALSKMVVV